MAIVGIPVIAPASGWNVRHAISNVRVEVPSSQDGVWIGAVAGTVIHNLDVAGGNGVNKYGLKVSGQRAKLSAITTADAYGSGIELSAAVGCQFSDIDIRYPRGHGIEVAAVSRRNQFNGVLLNNPSKFNSGTSDAIHIASGDGNTFDNVLFDPTAIATHKSAVDFSGGTDNRFGSCALVPGTVEAFLETAVGDNDFGMDVHRFIIPGTATVGTGVERIYAEVDRQIYACRVVANTAPTGANLIIDVNKDGSTIYTTPANRPTIIAAATLGAWTLPDRVASAGTQVAKGSYLTVDRDQIGSTIAGADLTVEIMWRKE